MTEVEETLDQIDRQAADFTGKWALPALRVALGITYFWFGALKIAGVSPVEDLVGKMSFVLPRHLFVKFMGVLESALGVALLFRLAMRPTLLLFFAQLAGTFMVFVVHPREAFRRGNPLKLTKHGEFIIKNLVLLTAGLAVGSTVRPDREEITLARVAARVDRTEARV